MRPVIGLFDTTLLSAQNRAWSIVGTRQIGAKKEKEGKREEGRFEGKACEEGKEGLKEERK